MTLLGGQLAADTLAVAVPDTIGRLIGKRVPIDRYDDLVRTGLSMPDFHLVTGVDNEPRDGLDDRRAAPWLPQRPRSASTRGRFGRCRGSRAPRSCSPTRSPRRARLPTSHRAGCCAGRLSASPRLGLAARCATELEFYLYRGSYDAAALRADSASSFRPITWAPTTTCSCPAGWRTSWARSAARCRSRESRSRRRKGEGGFGQHEVALEHAPPLEAADRSRRLQARRARHRRARGLRRDVHGARSMPTRPARAATCTSPSLATVPPRSVVRAG